MKKRIIFASMLLVLGIGMMSFATREHGTRGDKNAPATTEEASAPQMEDRVSDEAINRCKTVIAYYFNQVAADEFFPEKSWQGYTINRVKDTLQAHDLKQSLIVTDEIVNLEIDNKQKDSVLYFFTIHILDSESALYSDGKNTKLKAFLTKTEPRKAAIKAIGPTIKNEISAILDKDLKDRKAAFNAEQNKKKQKEKDDEPKTNGGNTIALLGVLLGLIGTGLGGYCFWQMRKMQESIRKQKGRVKELRERVDEMEIMKRDISSLKSEMRNQQNEVDDRFAQMKRNNMRAPEAPRGGAQQSAQPTQAAPQRPAAPAEPQTLYAGLPSGDTFTDASPRNTNKSFYKIDLRGSNNGEFEFISNPTTINYAKSSTTQFIECACNIVDNAGGFSNVITTRKGKVEKSGNDWKIVQKAEVRLS
ncbi:MAG: hypothetical protein K5864_01095 [Bacteroidales bacterium]|nr:hypothetical protein [Bacteroidales bacterium]